MSQLVRNEELNDLDVRCIPTYDRITEWLYQTSEKPVRKYDLEKIITDFESFQKFLKEIIEDTQLDQQDLTQVRKEDIASTLSQAVVHLRSRYAHKYADVLITILLHEFQSSNRDNVINLLIWKTSKLCTHCFPRRERNLLISRRSLIFKLIYSN